MPRRSAVGLDEVASLDTLAAAYWRASRGARRSDEPRRFGRDLDRNLHGLREDILAGRAPDGRWTSFLIRDPKVRNILAPCFRDRVLHHALMAHMGPVLDRALVDDTFACRVGRGTLVAVQRARQHLRRHDWYVQIDIRAYFASVDHGILMGVLARRFKHPTLLALCARILASSPGTSGLGLPIGALTSQHFANSYLDGFDRYLLETLRVQGMVRYMDDVAWWCGSRAQARETLDAARTWLRVERALTVKPDARVAPSAVGIGLLGFRVSRGGLRLSLRRRQRYAAARRRWERWFADGTIDAQALQAGHDAALAITAHADAKAWHGAELARRPPIDA